MSEQNILFSGTSLSDEIYTKREKTNRILGVYIVILPYNEICDVERSHFGVSLNDKFLNGPFLF